MSTLEDREWTLIWDAPAGYRIDRACEEIIAEADRTQKSVIFMFSGTTVHVKPGDTLDQVIKRWTDRRR